MSPFVKQLSANEKNLVLSQVVGDFQKLDTSRLRYIDLISDLYGVSTYTPQLDEAILKAGRMLKAGGVMVIISKWPHAHLVDADGMPIQVTRWFNQIRGMELVDPLGFRRGDVIALRRTWETIKVPKLSLVSFWRGGISRIPHRVYYYEQKNTAP